MANSALALVESSTQADDVLPPRKYKYEEFDGARGEEYLNVLLQQVLPAALWRTWHWAVSFQAPGNPLYVSAGKLAERVRPGERKVYLDLQKLEAHHLLQTTHARKEIVQSDGTVTTRVVTIKNFERLYDLAHEYHEWIHSPEYLPPARECIELIQATPHLAKKLIRFDNYRRLLLCQKPGRKPKLQADWYCWEPDQEATETQRSLVQENGTGDLKLNLYLNGRDNSDSPKRISTNSPKVNPLNKDSFDSEVPSNMEGGALSSSTHVCSQKRACSGQDYTKAATNEKRLLQSTNETPPPTQTNATNHPPSALETGRPKRSTRRESAELEPAVQMARRAMAIAQSGGSGSKAKHKYVGDGKPRPRPNAMVDAFLNEFGPVLGDRNQKGSLTATLRTAQASGLEKDLDLLMCLVRAYTVARDTREVRPAHRHPDGDNRMPIFFAMFRTFTAAWAADNFHYAEDDLVADIAADERLRNWVMERGLQPEVTDHAATAQGEELVEAAITRDGFPSSDMAGEGEAAPSQQEEEHLQGRLGCSRATARRIRTAEEKEARKAYARKVRNTLLNEGVPGMLDAMVENEHPCGCPLLYDTDKKWQGWKCAHCFPHPEWSPQVRDLIESVRTYTPPGTPDESQGTRNTRSSEKPADGT